MLIVVSLKVFICFQQIKTFKETINQNKTSDDYNLGEILNSQIRDRIGTLIPNINAKYSTPMTYTAISR